MDGRAARTARRGLIALAYRRSSSQETLKDSWTRVTSVFFDPREKLFCVFQCVQKKSVRKQLTVCVV